MSVTSSRKPSARKHIAIILIALGASLLALGASSQAGSGSRFRVTSKMEMAGFSMPGQTHEVCGPKDGSAQSLVPKQDNCRVENYRASGNKVTFDMICTGKDAMTGSGELEMLGAAGYRGKMRATVEGQQMLMSFEGKRIGDCNYATESPKAKADAMIGKSCADMLAQPGAALIGAGSMFIGPQAMCAAKKPAFCAKVTPLANDLTFLRSQKQLDELAAKQGTDMQGQTAWDALAGCGLPRATVVAKACAKADAANDYDFIGDMCPTLIAGTCSKADPNRAPDFLITHCAARADGIAKQHCTSRSFTAGFEGPYGAFCNRYAARRLNQRNEGQPSQQPPAKKPTLRDRLRGVIGG